MDANELLFFDGQPAVLALYAVFREKLVSRWPDVQIKVQKTQISFYNRHLFACVFLPVRKFPNTPREYLGVTLGLARRAEERAAAISEPYPGRFTHHFAVSFPEEMDESFFSLVEEAYAFAMSKR